MKYLKDKEFMINRLVPFIIFLIAIYFPLFMHLGNDVLGMWDESLYALRALYMEHNGEYLINFNQIEGGNNHPNTKPPLFTVVQALFFRIFGYSELSLRLPVAISVLLMLFFLVYFTWKAFKMPAIGIFSSLVLVTSPGFVSNHVSRTGDHDAVLAVLSLFVILYFYTLLNSNKNHAKYIWVVAFFLACSVLTKSIAGLFPLPAMFLFAIYKKKLLKLLSSWHTWASIVAFLLVVGSFYLYTERTAPGYLLDTWRQDVGGRYSGNLLGHNKPWYYYINLLYRSDFIPWVSFIPLTIIAIYTRTGKIYREISLYLLFVTLTYLMIISNSSTKLEWYHAAMFPPMALVVGIGITWLLNTIQKYFSDEKQWIKSLITVAFVIFILAYPYMGIVKKVEHPSKVWREEQYGEFMRKVEPDLNYTVVHERYVNTCVIFYVEVLKIVENKEVEIKGLKSHFEPGEILMCPRDTSWVPDKYTMRILEEYKELALMEIIHIKQ